MEELPVEIVGDILSRIADARDVVLASMTCRKWRRAFRDHLRALSFKESEFEDSEWDGFQFQYLSGSQLEALMSRTISQTTCLQSLIIDTGYLEVELSVSVVMSWLLHTRKSLREFLFDVDNMNLPLNVVAICGCEKLEKVTLAYGVIGGVDPDHHRFPSLKSLSLIACASVPDTDLRALVSACPELESLELINLGHHPVQNFKLVSPSLRRFYVGETLNDLDSLIFESDSVEHLHLKLDELVQRFKFIGKGTLTNLTIDATVVLDLEICDSAVSLESIDIIESYIPASQLYQLILKSSNLQKLRLWDVSYQVWSVTTDLETVAVSCPQLSLLFLGCGLRDNTSSFPYFLGGSTRFKNMIYLEVGWHDSVEEDETFSDDFFDLVEGLLDRCPSLKQLVISRLNDLKDSPHFSTPISRIRRKCVDSNVQLDFN